MQSSAKSLIFESKFLQISFTYTRNGCGHKTLPCGEPEVTLTSLDRCPPTLTLCARPTRNSLIQTTTIESTSKAASFVSSRLRGNKWEGLGKVYYERIYTDPLVHRVRYILAHCDDLLSRSKPMLSLYNQSFLPQTCLKYHDITCSSCLQTTEDNVLVYSLWLPLDRPLCK